MCSVPAEIAATLPSTKDIENLALSQEQAKEMTSMLTTQARGGFAKAKAKGGSRVNKPKAKGKANGVQEEGHRERAAER